MQTQTLGLTDTHQRAEKDASGISHVTRLSRGIRNIVLKVGLAGWLRRHRAKNAAATVAARPQSDLKARWLPRPYLLFVHAKREVNIFEGCHTERAVIIKTSLNPGYHYGCTE